MGLTREEAWAHLCSWTETASLRKHARAVELVMRAAAARYGGVQGGLPLREAAGSPTGDQGQIESWGRAGMLHDADYEKWPEEHPQRIVAWLKERGEEEVAYAISAHYTRWGVPYRSAMDKALLACDELTGFVMACALVRPEGIATLDVGSVKKKLKNKSFAAKVDRSEIEAGARELGVELEAHVGFVIEALKAHAGELELLGRA